jgi:hypothetical protein
MLAVDQRAIAAVCSPRSYHYSAEHFTWGAAFTATCREEGVRFSNCGDYQKRLEIYRTMPPLYKDGLSKSYHNGFDGFEDAKTPTDFERYNPIRIWCRSCANLSASKENLYQLCSRCKVVSYCSKECQTRDWPYHKKQCKNLGELRKDTAKVSEIAKNFEDIQ